MNILKKIKDLGLPPDQFVVMGSAIMQIKGIREAEDIDIIVTQELFERLKATPNWDYKKEWGEVGGGIDVESLDNGDGVVLYQHIHGGGTIDYFLGDPQNIEKIDCLYFASLENLLKVKGTSWDRPKDVQDAELIKAYLEKHASST